MREHRTTEGKATNNRGFGRSAGISTALTVAGVSLLMLVLPVATATITVHTTVLSPPFKGTVLPQNSKVQYGCGTLNVGQPARFSLTNGVGGFAAQGKAAICPSNQFWVGTSASNQANGEFQVATPIHVPAKASHIVADLSASWKAVATASDGGRARCTQGDNWENTQYYAAWNYTKTTSGAFYANDNGSWADRTTYPWFTTWSNGTTGNSPMVHPWHFTNTTFFQWFHNWGGSSSCYATASVSGSYSDYLVDETNGAYITQTGNTLAVSSGRQFFNLNVYVSNYTSWSCHNSTYWDGPSSTWSNATISCNSANGTVTSVSTITAPTYSSSSGHNNSATLTSTASISGNWYWNSTFVRSHHYELFFDVQLVGSSQDSWSGHGFASFYLSMAGLTNGFRLLSITAS